jgi:uncharacterized membrane protein YccC
MGLIRDAARVRPVDTAGAFALRAGLAVALPLVVLVAAGHIAWASVATFGSFAALYARDAHYRSRAVVVAVAGLGLVAAVVLGTLTALTPWPEVAGIVAVSVTGAIATLVCTAFQVGPPAALMFAFATAVIGTLPATAGSIGRNALLAGAAAVASWLITMAGAAIDRDAPRRLAVARALRLAAALNSAPPGSAGLRLRQQAAGAIERAWRSLPPEQSAAAGRRETIVGLERLIARAETELAATAPRPAPDSAADRTGSGPDHRAAGPSSVPVSLVPVSLVPGRPVPGGTGSAGEAGTPGSAGGTGPAERAAELRRLADGLGWRGAVPVVEASADESTEVSGRHQAARLIETAPRDLLRPDRRASSVVSRAPLVPVALRVAVGALAAGAAAGLLAHFTGIGHPYWAAVSAVAVLQAASLQLSMQRALQRAAGTLVGVLLAAAAIAVPGGHWVLVGEIVAAQVIAEILVVRNYGLAMLAVTPLALLVGELGRPTAAGTLMTERITQTVLGCALGLLCAVLIRNRAAARHLAGTITATTAETAKLRLQLTAGPAAGDPTEQARRLALLITSLREAYDVAAGEPGLPPGTTESVLTAERQARQILAEATPRLLPAVAGS